MILWTLRHPPVDRKGRCIGQTVIETTMSTDDAVQQAVANAPFRPARLFSSDLPRCADLANGLAKAWAIPVQTDPRLREMNFGEWEGRSYDAIDAEDGPRWRQWCDQWKTLAAPGGESLEDLTARICDWFEDTKPKPTDALVTHAGVIRCCRVLSGSNWDDAMSSDNPFLGWTKHHIREGSLATPE